MLMGFPAEGHLGFRHEAPMGSAKSMARPGKVSSSKRSATNMCRFKRLEIANADEVWEGWRGTIEVVIKAMVSG